MIASNLRRLSSFAAAAALSVLGCSPARAPTGDVVARWIADDPYVRAGVFAHYEVKPFRQTLP